MRIKPPFSYYGGKQQMAKKIIEYYPVHNLYGETHLGGGANFWGKEPSNVEVINDIDGRVINFYKMCKTQFPKLKSLIEQTPHSRKAHQEAAFVLENQDLYSNVKIAWAFWVQTNMSFGSAIGAGFGYGRKKNSMEKKLHNRRLNFTEQYCERLERVQIECTDATRVITSRDAEDSFFYNDPPYINTHCGHYGGYTEKDFTGLLECLSGIKGKFLLSSFNSDILDEFTKQFNWDKLEFEMATSMNHGKTRKIEVLTANYKLAA